MAVSIAALEERLSDVEVPILQAREESQGPPATATALEIFRNYSSVIPADVRTKLGAKAATGDRSKVLWRLELRLLECGLTTGEVVALLEGTVWNKFEDDRSRLWADVSKAAQKARSNGGPKRKDSKGQRPTKQRTRARTQPWAVPLDRYLAVESRDPRWMVEGLWADKSHGIIGGEPKTRKSYFAIDLALSVATGTSVFGHFKTVQKGTVLMIQEEISDAEMRKRLRHIAAAKGLGGKIRKDGDAVSLSLPKPVPFFLRNRQGFDLSKDECFIELEKEIREREVKMLILDPLQMMLGSIDENRTSELRPVLKNFLQLKEATGCGILIVHHMSKSNDRNQRTGGQRLAGSHALHGWVESAVYLSKPEPYITQAEREFRNFEPHTEFEIEYGGGEDRYAVSVQEKRPPKPMSKFERWCVNHPNTPVKELANRSKKSEKVIGRAVERSPYLEVKRLKTGSRGRPVNVVARATVVG